MMNISKIFHILYLIQSLIQLLLSINKTNKLERQLNESEFHRHNSNHFSMQQSPTSQYFQDSTSNDELSSEKPLRGEWAWLVSGQDDYKQCVFCANCCKCPQNSMPDETEMYQLNKKGDAAEQKQCEVDECDIKCTCEKDQANDLVYTDDRCDYDLCKHQA